MADQLFYIQNGFSGNAIMWWGVNRGGYTSDIRAAGKYSREEAMAICKRPEDIAWPCDYVDKQLVAQKVIVDAQYLDVRKRRTWRRKVKAKKAQPYLA